jgi:hypothetical protein
VRLLLFVIHVFTNANILTTFGTVIESLSDVIFRHFRMCRGSNPSQLTSLFRLYKQVTGSMLRYGGNPSVLLAANEFINRFADSNRFTLRSGNAGLNFQKLKKKIGSFSANMLNSGEFKLRWLYKKNMQ